MASIDKRLSNLETRFGGNGRPPPVIIWLPDNGRDLDQPKPGGPVQIYQPENTDEADHNKP